MQTVSTSDPLVALRQSKSDTATSGAPLSHTDIWARGRLEAFVLAVPVVIAVALCGFALVVPDMLGGDYGVSWAIGLTVLGASGWIGVVWWFMRKVGRAVSHLEMAALRVTTGDFGEIARQPMPMQYLSDLQNSFGLMVDRLREITMAREAQMDQERAMREELQSLQRQVIRQERLAAVGLLVSGVAHEINNPLQAILGFAELLQMQHDLPDAVHNDLQLIQKESARACGIIRNLALFARQQPGHAAAVKLGDVVNTIADLRRRRLESEQIELLIDSRAGRPVSAVFSELQQVVLNFVVNAEQVILSSGRLPGRITIRTRDQGARILLEVEDTGTGVAPEHEAKLFQPFFTTKAVGEGTGLGLSVSYGIIDSMGGKMGYRPAPAGGAIFYFELPASMPE